MTSACNDCVYKLIEDIDFKKESNTNIKNANLIEFYRRYYHMEVPKLAENVYYRLYYFRMIIERMSDDLIKDVCDYHRELFIDKMHLLKADTAEKENKAKMENKKKECGDYGYICEDCEYEYMDIAKNGLF